MKLQMHSIHFDADRKLLDFVQKKADKLEKYFDKIIDGEVYLKLSKNGNNENKVVELKINIPGNSLFAKEQDRTFEAATESVVEALRRQLKKHKEKQYESL